MASRSRFRVCRLRIVVSALLAVAASGWALALPVAAAPSLVPPYLQLTASTNTIVGLQVFAMVNLQGTSPTGTLTFSLFGPAEPACAQAPLFVSTVAVTGVAVDSGRYTTTLAGTYRWEVSYSGDANNAASPPSACTNPTASVVVSPMMSAVSVTAMAPSGGSIAATAQVGGYYPTGNVTFYLTSPGDTFCSGSPAFISTVPVNGAGSYTSGRYQLPGGGQYKWRAIYSGDVNNTSTVSACLDPNAAVTVPGWATFVYPQNGSTKVDPANAFTWSPVSTASAYFLTVGTTPGGWDLLWSGSLPPTQTSYAVKGLPAGTVYATIYTLTNGVWTGSQTVSFTAVVNQARFKSPASGQASVSTTAPFTWTTVPGVAGYAVWIGTTYGANDLLSTGLIAPTQGSLVPPTLPAGRTLYAILFTVHADNSLVFQAVTFTTAGGTGIGSGPATPACTPIGMACGPMS